MNKKTYTILLVLMMLAVLFVVSFPQTTLALENPVTLEVGIGSKTTTDSITDYIKTIYLFATGIVGGLAAVMIVIGAIQYSTAAGNPKGISSAKETIISAIIGLVLVGTAYLILGVFGTQFTNLNEPELPEISTFGQGSSDQYQPIGERCAGNETYYKTEATCEKNCSARSGNPCRQTTSMGRNGRVKGYCCEL
ncbi:pilin [Patescibacteria group bacterium]